MHSRKEHLVKAIRFPQDWEAKVSELLNSTYEAKLKESEGFFEIYGMTYPEEVMLVITLKSTDPEIWPITLKMSADLEKNKDSQKLMDTLLNSVGVYLDQFFANSDPTFDITWQKAEFEKEEIWYLSSREDFGLTLEADKLLGEDYSSL